MTRAELLALADRVEREEPSDDLNWHIGQTQPVTRGKPRWLDYCTSLDAAASLMPPGHTVSIAIGDDCVACSPFRRDAYDNLIQVMGSAPTEPRARTAAALLARAMEMKDE